ncbi:winged helix-turn-helix domain-containing protein [Nonomuraea sp. K274]|uniref:Winged helix-turn-helix domain-containing protein n=1 Tax=Nonomuraea cypriaca TaxID=1187855 RepID=A0A931EVV4_9ACTN|nr:AfsR/SARP family transcriptional regulator [Nonomuraea cypriaca]MBF8184550.1 winged helix-turn-helix domain-containing protein [Nonomuraea cypriaca]
MHEIIASPMARAGMRSETWFGILGPLIVTVGGRPVHLGGPRARAALAALLLADGQIVPIERLIDQIWEDEPPASGRNQVMIAVSTLRKAFRTAGGDPDLIETVACGYRIRTADLDAHQAEVNLAQARQAPLAWKAALLRETLGLWRGQVLAGISTRPLRAVASRWEELRLSVLEDWAEAELDLGRHRELVGVLGVSVAEHPLRERIRAQLMLALHRSGRQAEALEVYDQGRAVLVEELGLEPGHVLRDMHAAILRDEPGVRWAGAGARPARAAGGESGTWQAGSGVRPAQLPPAVSAFTGRRRELGALDTLLDRQDGSGELPLCVVYGMAGVGKTGLAVSWAHRVADRFPDGQLFADLRGHARHAPPLRPEAVLARFLRALGLPERSIPAGLDERTALFRSLLEGRRALIVLDDAASAAQVRPLLAGSDSCCVVITSRSPLGGLVAQDGARCVGLDVLSPQEAEELLGRMVGAERMARERPAARELGELCDRLPLALRIAAAKLMARSDWTVSGMAARLESEQGRLDELRHAELEVRGSFELSYRALPQAAKVAFRRLGLLDPPGGFAAWTVAALAEVPLPIAEKLCEHLVDAQLARPLDQDATGCPRYGFHDLVRLFSKERAHVEEALDSRTAAVVPRDELSARARRADQEARRARVPVGDTIPPFIATG